MKKKTKKSMKQAHYNNQGRKSGGHPKFKIRIGMPMMSNGEPLLHASLPCGEGRHGDCDGYQTFMPKKNITRCGCACHQEEFDL